MAQKEKEKKLQKETYEKPNLEKEGTLRDITAAPVS